MSWDVPTKDFCPECGKTLFKRAGKGRNKPYCINEACPAFVPEDKRGYKKKTAPAAEGEPAPAEETKEAEPVKKTTRKSKKDADTGEKPSKKSAAKKTAAKKS